MGFAYADPLSDGTFRLYAVPIRPFQPNHLIFPSTVAGGRFRRRVFFRTRKGQRRSRWIYYRIPPIIVLSVRACNVELLAAPVPAMVFTESAVFHPFRFPMLGPTQGIEIIVSRPTPALVSRIE